MEIVDKVIVNENIYILKKNKASFFSKAAIERVFKLAKDDKNDQSCKKLNSAINLNRKTNSGIDYRLSLLFLQYFNNPTFLTEFVSDEWLEKKIAYLFLLDFQDFVIILRKNISGIQSFLNTLNEVEYNIISKVLIDNTTLFEKFSTQNLDISKKAIRTRAVEADDLTENYNFLGANTYALNLLRINNNNQRYVISLNTSRISKTGTKIDLDKVGNWSSELIEAIRTFVDKESFLDVFATPCLYADERDELVPNALTILFARLIDDVSLGKISKCIYSFGTEERNIDLLKYIKTSNASLGLELESDYSYRANRNTVPKALLSLKVRLNPVSIRLSSLKLARIKLYKQNGTNESLIEYLNNTQSFVLNFDNCEYVYSNRNLFRDSKLLGSIEYFLKAFKPYTEISSVTTEKGTVTSGSTKFSKNSMFSFVEDKFRNDDFLVLDDLGDEWADHISIHEETITFIHSKCDSSLFSATAFTEIVGQALKNFGNMYSTDLRIRNKKSLWSDKFRLDSIQTNIPRLRKGASVQQFIDKYIDVKNGINPKRRIFLALNFISKAELTANLDKLKKGTPFREKKQSIQILWFISSLIANCRENSIELEIMCKP